MITFVRSAKLADRAQAIVKKYHGDLAEVELTVGVLMAERDESGEPSVKESGYPVEAKAKITPYRDRVLGVEDLIFTCDAFVFKDLAVTQIDAWLDRLLTSVELVRDDEGEIKADDCGRPKLKKRLCDWMLSGYDIIAERHGQASPEARAFANVYAGYHQTFFQWVGDMGAVA